MSNQAANVDSIQDINGYTVFSAGKTGAAHTMAHRMFDENRIELVTALEHAAVVGVDRRTLTRDTTALGEARLIDVTECGDMNPRHAQKVTHHVLAAASWTDHAEPDLG